MGRELSRKGVCGSARPIKLYAGGCDEMDNKEEDWEVLAVEPTLRCSKESKSSKRQ